jgi:transcriptional regulator with XRE-family HTH domain
VPPADGKAVGRALAKLRSARGFTQQEVAARIPTHYSDASTYGRIERSERYADRDTLIAILVRGLSVSDVSEINRLLQLADFQALSPEEVEQCKLAPSETIAAKTEPGQRRHSDWLSAGILSGTAVLAGLIALLVPRHAVFVVVSSCLYAALYVVSLYLESAFEPERLRPKATVAICFCIIALSSAAALAADRLLVDSGNSLALLPSLVIFLLAAIGQFLVVRPTLPETAIVPASFQTRTAQAAHLKNTGYFLLIVVLFWLPSFHCISTLERELGRGHSDWVRQVLEHDLMLGLGLLALSVRCLLLLLLSLFVVSLVMAYPLLDNLRPHARLNNYTILFYLRAFLYFLSCLACIGWYAYSLSALIS